MLVALLTVCHVRLDTLVPRRHLVILVNKKESIGVRWAITVQKVMIMIRFLVLMGLSSTMLHTRLKVKGSLTLT